MDDVQRLVLSPLTSILALFQGPQRLIQKRQDKCLDFDSKSNRIEKTKDKEWLKTYSQGWFKLDDLKVNEDSNHEFAFDILMANPPFAGDIKESRILAKYDLGKKTNGIYHTKVGRDILFIERNLDFLKPGGRMAIVLPQGRLNNSSDKVIRDYITNSCRILAVVSLHSNVFKPHTGTKTSVPAIALAGKVTVVLKPLKSKPSVAGFDELLFS